MKVQSRRIFIAMAVLSFGLFFESKEAFARRRTRFRSGIRSTGPKTYSNDVLTPSEIENCLNLQRQIEQSDSNLEKFSISLEQEKQSLDDLSLSLDRQQRSLNRYSQADVNAYNKAVAFYEKKRQAFNYSVNQYNDEVQRINSSIDNFNKLCGQKLYYEDDMISARTKLGLPKLEN